MNINQELKEAQKLLGYRSMAKLVAELQELPAIRKAVTVKKRELTVVQEREADKDREREHQLNTLRENLTRSIQSTLAEFQLGMDGLFTDADQIHIQSICDGIIQTIGTKVSLSRPKNGNGRTRRANKKILGYSLDGNTVECSTYKAVLVGVCNYCIQHGSGIIDEILPSISGRTRIYFSQNPESDNLTSPQPLKGTPWYVDTHFGENMVNSICNQLAREFRVGSFSINHQETDRES